MRNKQRFGSEFNRWVYENCNHEFYFGNVDGYSVKMSTNPPVMRIWENKHHNESVSPGQMRLLREMAFLIRIGIRDGKYHPASGVFLVYGNPLQDQRYRIVDVLTGEAKEVDSEELRMLVECSDVKK
jgi:hypothetical protein